MYLDSYSQAHMLQCQVTAFMSRGRATMVHACARIRMLEAMGRPSRTLFLDARSSLKLKIQLKSSPRGITDA